MNNKSNFKKKIKYNKYKLKIFFGFFLIILFLNCCNSKPKVYRVGILSGLDFFANTIDGFKDKMTELGYIEGKNIFYDLQRTNFEPDKEQQILEKFVTDKVDLIFTFPTEVTMAAKAATQGTKIPVLFANCNIENVNLVKSVQEPGENITGVRFPGPDLAIKSFEIMHELVPEAKRFYLPFLKGYPNVKPQLVAVRPVAQAAGIILIEAPVSTPDELESDLISRVNGNNPGMDVIFVVAEVLAVTPDFINVIDRFAKKYKLPYDAGPGLGDPIYAITTEVVSVGKLAAVLGDKILKGIPAGTIPVVSAETWLQINYKKAQNLGLKVSDSLLSQANDIIR
jgi:putative ABC transport system substrate-binding protein